MGKPHPIELRSRVVAFVEEGHGHREAARHFRVSPRFVNDMVILTRESGEAMRCFAGIELGDDRIPDETTILNFRHLQARHRLTEAIFADVNTHLADKGITLRSGTRVDMNGRPPCVRVSPRKIINAPSGAKNA